MSAGTNERTADEPSTAPSRLPRRAATTVVLRALPALAVLALVLVANALPLSGIVDARPRASFAWLTVEQRPSILPGLSAIDPNSGWVTEALGAGAARSVLAGRVPWWDPYAGLGTPLAGDMQSAAFFPGTLLLALPDGALLLRLALQAATALGTLALLRRLGVRPAVAVPAAVALALSGTAAWFGHGPALVLPSLPLALLGVEHARDAVGTRRAGVSLLAVALALSLVAGFPETALLNGFLVAGWTLARMPYADRRAVLAFGARLAAALLLGLAMAAPALLAFVHLLGNADPGLHAGAGYSGVHLPARGLAMLLLPYVYGPLYAGVGAAPTLGPLTGSVGGYLPPGLLLLALVGLSGRRHRGVRVAVTVVSALLLARTAGVPVVSPLLDAVPGVRITAVDRYASPALSAAAVVLAALGMEDVLRRGLSRRAVLVPTGLVLAAVTVAAVVAAELPTDGADGLLRTSRWSSVAGAVVVVAAVAVGLAQGGRRGATLALTAVTVETLALFVVPQLSAPRDVRLDDRLVAFLQEQPTDTRSYSPALLHANYGSYYGVRTLQFTDALVPYAYLRVREQLRTPGAPPSDLLADVAARVEAWREAGVSLLVVPRGTPVPPAAAELLTPVLRTELADVHRLSGARPLWTGPCDLEPVGVLEVVTRCAEPAVLTHRSMWLPGWRADVDGTRVDAQPAGSWVAVPVPAGESRVRLTWAPPGADLSLGLAVLALATTAASPLAGRPRHLLVAAALGVVATGQAAGLVLVS